MGSRLGFEGEVADTPDFFEQTGFLTHRRVATVMGNALYRFRTGGARSRMPPAASGSCARTSPRPVTWRRSKSTSSASTSAAASSAHLSEHTGVRGDVRYLRTAGTSDADANPFGLDLTRFEFWRAYAGLVVEVLKQETADDAARVCSTS